MKDFDARSIADLRRAWQAALQSLTSTTPQAQAWLDVRYRFTCEVARQLVAPLAERDQPAVIYAVWLEGDHSAPVYVGQSTDPARRLWDLPIGESHHLANSFPPELWRKVVVIDWAAMLQQRPGMQAKIVEQLDEYEIETAKTAQSIALAIEFRLQQALRPLLNLRKKLRSGNWQTVDFERSRSAGARISRLPAVAELADDILGTLVQQSAGSNSPVPTAESWAVWPAELFTASLKP